MDQQAQQLWDSLHDLFDTDDGCLPDIEMEGLPAEAVAELYAFLRSRSELVGYMPHSLTGQPCFWSVAEQEEVPLDAVPNPARLMSEGAAEAFHVILGGLRFGGAVIPDLGLFVFSDALAFDYRMRPEWGPAQVVALFECLRQIQRIAPSVQIGLPAGELPGVRERFVLALQQYQNSGPV